MAEVGCSSPSEKLEKFQKSSDDIDGGAFSFEKFSDGMDVYSTPAPRNSASWTESLLGGRSSEGGGLGVDLLVECRVDEIVGKCFNKTKENEEKEEANDDPVVQIALQDEQLRQNELWSKITKNFGTVLPVDWRTTHAKKLFKRSLDIHEIKTNQSSDLDISDDEELQQTFDLHSLIISSLNEEPMFTVEQIISEIEGMLEDSPPVSADECEDFSPDLLKFKKRSQELKKSLQNKASTDLDGWSVRALSELYDEFDATVREYSDVLIHQLALREELEYEKELMNQFISLHLNIQKKKRELQQSDRKLGTTPTTESSGSISNLTTQIPYYPSVDPISVELLEVYVKILKAVDCDGSNLPTLLTDYILKVVCPTS